MKKIVNYIFIFALLSGIFSPLSSLNAQAIGSPCTVTRTGAPGTIQQSSTSGGGTFCAANDQAAAAQAAANNTPTAIAGAAAGAAASAAGKITGVIAGSIFAPVLSWIFQLVLKGTALLLWLAGMILNFVIDQTIVQMQAHVSNLKGINIAWKLIKDLMNIAFIFLLVYYGILVIIGQKTTNDIRKFIIGIVLASILINFSLFFTKVLIDTSNIVTLGVYSSITANNPPNSVANGYGLSGSYQQALGLQGMLGPDAFAFVKVDSDNYGLLVVLIMGSILFLITAFIFFSISVLLVVRYIILIVLMVLSPIAYMGFALPGIKKWAGQWWDSLWGQLLFAPIYMLMTWVILTLMDPKNGFTGVITDKSQWTAFMGTTVTQANSQGSISLFFNFALIIGLTILSLIIAKKYSTEGSGQIKTFSNWATAKTGTALFGTAAGFGRATFGRAGNALANNDSLKETAANGNLVTRRLAQFTLNRGNQAATSTFDARGNGAFSGLAKTTGMQLGKADDTKKATFRKELEAKSQSGINFAKSLKLSGDEEDKIKRERNYEELDKEGRKKVDAEIKKKYDDRVNAYAKQFENESKMWRYTKNLAKLGFAREMMIATGTMPSVTTKTDNREIARQIRKKARDKSKKERLADLAKEVDKEEREESGETEETTPEATPKPEVETPAEGGATT